MRLLGRLLWLCITIVLVVFAIAFAASNKAPLTLHLWPFDHVLTAPAWLLLLSSFIIGGLLSAILLWGQWFAIRAKLWRLERRFNKLQAKADKFNHQPDADQPAPHQLANHQHDEPATHDQLTADRRLR